MQKTADITLQNDHFQVTGDLDFCNVMFVYRKSLLLAAHCAALIFDFKQLRSCNSAGLALMVEWIKLSRQLNKPIQFLHLPSSAMVLANAAGMAEMLCP